MHEMWIIPPWHAVGENEEALCNSHSLENSCVFLHSGYTASIWSPIQLTDANKMLNKCTITLEWILFSTIYLQVQRLLCHTFLKQDTNTNFTFWLWQLSSWVPPVEPLPVWAGCPLAHDRGWHAIANNVLHIPALSTMPQSQLFCSHYHLNVSSVCITCLFPCHLGSQKISSRKVQFLYP
jgi:hypothetical protein